VDSALMQMDPAREKAYFRKAYEIIINDVPAVFLYEPRLTAGSHKRVRQTGMRPDAWWAGLADWWIPANERIDRDRIGLRAPATP
jgi:peptide/nickel transport system substrate-binding protein